MCKPADPKAPLRQPFLNTTDFTYAHANDAAIDPSTYYWTAINEVATASGRTLQTSNFSGTQNWTDTYKNCD